MCGRKKHRHIRAFGIYNDVYARRQRFQFSLKTVWRVDQHY